MTNDELAAELARLRRLMLTSDLIITESLIELTTTFTTLLHVLARQGLLLTAAAFKESRREVEAGLSVEELFDDESAFFVVNALKNLRARLELELGPEYQDVLREIADADERRPPADESEDDR
jgi:hypothetical protein